MSTRAIVGYRDSNGDFRGTYVHNDGNEAAKQLHDLFSNDAQALREWVDRGIQGEDYSSFTSEPYENLEDATDNMPFWTLKDIHKVNYVWEITEDGHLLHIT